MNAPEGMVTEAQKRALEQDSIDRLRRFVTMAVDDPSEKKRIKVSYVGQQFFGDFYIDKQTLQKALKP